MTEIDIEIHQTVIFFQSEKVGNIQSGVLEKIELILKIKIE